MIYDPTFDPFATGDAAEKFILEAAPDADPWQLGWEEGEYLRGRDGVPTFCWVRYDGKQQYPDEYRGNKS